MNFKNWPTILSKEVLYFGSLQDDGNLLIHIKNKANEEYSIQFKNNGPYLVIDEDLRVEMYWSKLNHFIGNTFEVVDSPFVQSLENEPMFENTYRNPRHLVIKTIDVAIEVVTEELPRIKKY